LRPLLQVDPRTPRVHRLGRTPARARGLPPREGAGRRVAAVDGLSVAARAGTHPARPAPRLVPAGQRGERGAAHALGQPVPDRRRRRCRHLRGAVPRLDAGRTRTPRSGARGAARPRPGVLVPAGCALPCRRAAGPGEPLSVGGVSVRSPGGRDAAGEPGVACAPVPSHCSALAGRADSPRTGRSVILPPTIWRSGGLAPFARGKEEGPGPHPPHPRPVRGPGARAGGRGRLRPGAAADRGDPRRGQRADERGARIAPARTVRPCRAQRRRACRARRRDDGPDPLLPEVSLPDGRGRAATAPTDPTLQEPPMKTRAAVAFEPGKPLQIVELDLEGPKQGEVLVKITHT